MIQQFNLVFISLALVWKKLGHKCPKCHRESEDVTGLFWRSEECRGGDTFPNLLKDVPNLWKRMVITWMDSFFFFNFMQKIATSSPACKAIIFFYYPHRTMYLFIVVMHLGIMTFVCFFFLSVVIVHKPMQHVHVSNLWHFILLLINLSFLLLGVFWRGATNLYS